MAERRRFDRAELTDETGKLVVLSWDEFWAMSLARRVGYLSKGAIKFFLAGQPVGPKDAIQR